MYYFLLYCYRIGKKIVFIRIMFYLFEFGVIFWIGWVIVNFILKFMEEFMYDCGFVGMNLEMVWIVVISE